MKKSYFVCITCIVACHIFTPIKENKITFKITKQHKHSQDKHLFIYTVLFPHVS